MPDDIRHRYAEAIHGALFGRDKGSTSMALSGAAARAVMAVRDEEMERVRQQVADYENAVLWTTSCTGCANSLDQIRRQEERAEKAEAAIARVRELHRVHHCSVDGHKLATTRSPCVNDGVCSCGQRGDRCPTRAALDDTIEEETETLPLEEET